MTLITFDANEVPPADLGSPGPTSPDERRRTGSGALRLVGVPLAISLAVNAIFLVVWWLPEYSRFPGHEALLTQLSPLASKELTSLSQPVVAAQQDRSGLVAAFLLVAAIALPPLARASRWMLRLLAPMAICYLGVVGLVITLLSVVSHGLVGRAWFGLLLLAAWVAAAGATVWRGFRVQAEDLPGRPTRVLWLVGMFALLNPLPLALGRWLFTPELAEAAHGLAAGDPALRFAALNSSATVATYLSGVFLGLVVWAWYMLVPPLQPLRAPWLPGSTGLAAPLGARLCLLAACVLGLALSGMTASHLGAARATQIQTGSPAADLPLTCQAWTRPRGAKPVLTLLTAGPSCRSVVTYVGYARTHERRLSLPLAPIRASTPQGQRIRTRAVGAAYGNVVVLAGSTRLDLQPDQLVAVRLTDARLLWTFRCDDDLAMRLRYARADGGDDPAAGRVTEFVERPSVVVSCTNQPVRLDPRTGKPLA